MNQSQIIHKSSINGSMSSPDSLTGFSLAIHHKEIACIYNTYVNVIMRYLCDYENAYFSSMKKYTMNHTGEKTYKFTQCD